jgi:hypothetical protein
MSGAQAKSPQVTRATLRIDMMFSDQRKEVSSPAHRPAQASERDRWSEGISYKRIAARGNAIR